MKLQNKLLFTCSFIVMLGLAGCAHYQSKPLKSLAKVSLRKKEAKDNSISVSYNVFSKKDCKKYLDRNVIAKGYQPVQVTITNNTNRYIDISTKRFSFPCASFEEVAEKVHTSTVARAVGYGVLGAFLWPFIIPAIVDGVGSSKANEQLDKDFERKALEEGQVLSPFSAINGLVFVPKEEFNKSDFAFTVVDTESQEQFVFNDTSLRVEVQA